MYRSFHVSVMWWASLDEGIYLPTCQSNPSSSCIPFSREKEIMQRAPLLKPPSGQRGTSCDAYGVDMIRGEGGKGCEFCFVFLVYAPPLTPMFFSSLSINWYIWSFHLSCHGSSLRGEKYLDRVHVWTEEIEISGEKKEKCLVCVRYGLLEN